MKAKKSPAAYMTVGQFANELVVDQRTVRSLLIDEPGVIRVPHRNGTGTAMIRIPLSVVERSRDRTGGSASSPIQGAFTKERGQRLPSTGPVEMCMSQSNLSKPATFSNVWLALTDEELPPVMKGYLKS